MALKDLIPWRKADRGDVDVKDDNPFMSLHREIDRLFDGVYRGFGHGFGMEPLGPFGSARVFSPKIDVSETSGELRVTAELPGLSENDVELSLSGDALRIEGHKKEETEDKGEGYYKAERSYGSFVRTIALPVEVDPEGALAKFKDGVLTVRLRKAKEDMKRKIAITKV